MCRAAWPGWELDRLVFVAAHLKEGELDATSPCANVAERYAARFQQAVRDSESASVKDSRRTRDALRLIVAQICVELLSAMRDGYGAPSATQGSAAAGVIDFGPAAARIRARRSGAQIVPLGRLAQRHSGSLSITPGSE